jgi:hypothetical protein
MAVILISQCYLSSFAFKEDIGRYILRSFRKLKEDMPLSAAKIEDDTLARGYSASILLSSISFYLPISSSTSFYLNYFIVICVAP